MNLKKSISAAVALILSACMTSGVFCGTAMKVSANTNSGSFLYGDVNDDGIVNVSDITKIAAYVKGHTMLKGKAIKAADVNGDGIVFTDDITGIANHIKGKRSLSHITPNGKLTNSYEPTNVFIVYFNPGSDFLVQAYTMSEYAYSDKNTKMLFVNTTEQFIDAWNNKFDDAENIHLFLHGEPGILCFRDDDIDYSQIKKLKSHAVNNNIYLYSCYSGARWMGSTVASEISDRCYGAPVEAIYNDGVDYNKKTMLPESHQGGDWKMFYSTPNENKTYTHHDVTVGKKWRLDVHINSRGELVSGSGGKF